MKEVRCINAKDTTVLQEGVKYYAFPVNSTHAYISKFPRKGAHMGCYSLCRFNDIKQIVEQRELCEYHYVIKATGNKKRVYGYAVTPQLVAIYKDCELNDYIGCVSNTLCEYMQTIAIVNKWATHKVFPDALRIGDFDNVTDATELIEIADQYEQWSLF